jgi:group I intron endonuclease
VGCVYQVENTINGKLYIGKTILPLTRRIAIHKSDAKIGSNYLFHSAIRKYGFKSFMWNKIYLSDNDDILCAKEIEFIKVLKTKVPFGYNLTDGGEGSSGYHPSPETLLKIRKPRTDEQKERMSKAQTGKILSKEHKENISRALKGKQKAKSTKKRNRKAHSDETKRKISKSLTGRTVSMETRQKRRLNALNYWRTKKGEFKNESSVS